MGKKKVPTVGIVSGIKYHVLPLKKIPLKNKDNTLRGYHKPRTKDVYLTKGKHTLPVKYHETYHAIKNHPDKPHNPQIYVSNEIEAWLYSYGKIKQPHNIHHALRAILSDLVDDYRIAPSVAIRMIGNVMNRYEIPDGWKNSYKSVVSESYGGRTIPKDIPKL